MNIYGTLPQTGELNRSARMNDFCQNHSSSKSRFHADSHNEFHGLDKGVRRYDLLLLVKRIGKTAGFSARMIELLDYYMAFTRDQDWEEGAHPIVYQSLARTSLDLGLSERQIQRLEHGLFKLGALKWNDSGNHKRYGQRDPESGDILYAYGVDLSPLAALRESLEQNLHEKQLYDRAWMEAKRQISWYRAQIRGIINEMEQGGDNTHTEHQARYDEIAVRIRTSIKLEQLHTLRDQHKALYEDIAPVKNAVNNAPKKEPQTPHTNTTMTVKKTGRDVKNVVHKKESTHKKSNKLDSSKLRSSKFLEKDSRKSQEQILQTGLQHISLGHVLELSSDELQSYIPYNGKALGWADIVEACYQMTRELDISQA